MAAGRVPGDDLPHPVRRIIFKVHLPANATLDRVFLVVMIAVFLASRAVNGRSGPRRRLTPVEIAMLVFGGIALLSIVLNIDRIYQQNELSFVEKQFSQLLAYGAFFFVAIATVRPEEVPAFTRLIMALACLTAVGTSTSHGPAQRVLPVVGEAAGARRDRRQRRPVDEVAKIARQRADAARRSPWPAC